MNKKNNNIFDEDSIDLIELLSTLWKKKILIFRSILIFTLIGIIYSFSLKNKYTASSVFYPHYQNNEIGQSQGLRNLAGIAGINLESQNTNNIPTTLYPNIINSPEFKIEILDALINSGQNEMSYRKHLLIKNSQLNLKKILFFPISILDKYFSNSELKPSNKNSNILELNKEEYFLHTILSNIIFIELNEK